MKLRISDNNRFFVTMDGKPFVWLADTAWTMPQRMKWDDVMYYMKKRKEQGFTVLQIVALDPEMDEQMRNPAGKKALLGNNLSMPNEEYFTYLDWIIDQAKAFDFHVLLLPVWGQLVVGHNWMGQTFEKTVTEENAYEYGRWIGDRYKDRDHIVWCLGGDRQPIHLGVDYKNVWRRLAEGLAKGLTGNDLKHNESHDLWKKLLITYHACHEMETGECSTMSYWTDEDAWISFIMLQSGHGTAPKNYELVAKEYNREITMPVWDGEPAYEMMPTSWPEIKEYHDEWMVRKRAYWSLFSGSFGHTYGHASVWCTISDKEKNPVMKYSWFDALHSTGSAQMKILRDFLESRDLSSCVPASDMLKHQRTLQQEGIEQDVIKQLGIKQDGIEQVEASVTAVQIEQTKYDGHVQACRNREGKFACCYFPMGGQGTIDVSTLNGSEFDLWWFNPRDGKCYDHQMNETDEALRVQSNDSLLEVKTPTQGIKEDWVLVVDVDGAEYAAGRPGQTKAYSLAQSETEIKKVFEW